MSQIIVVKDSANNKLRELESNSSGELKTTVADVSALALESSLSALNGKITACDTGSISGTVAVSAVAGSVACTHAALPLPSGAATETTVASSAASLTTLAGAVSAGVVQVSAGSSSASSQSAFSSAPIAAAGNITSSGMSISSKKEVCVFGSTNNPQGQVVVQVSDDDIDYYELNNVYITVDYSSGDFGMNFPCSANYVRLKRTNESAVSESITAIISAK